MWIQELIERRGFPALHLESPAADVKTLERQEGSQSSFNREWQVIQVGDVEVVVDRSGIAQLKIDFRNGTPAIPKALGIISPAWHSHIDLYDALNLIDDAELNWQIDQRLSFDRQLTLRVQDFCELSFDLDRRELLSVKLLRSTMPEGSA